MHCSEIVWHLSALHFAKNEDSSLFSGVNVLMVGIRGMIAPAFGSLLGLFFGCHIVLFFGMLLCLLATERAFSFQREGALLAK